MKVKLISITGGVDGKSAEEVVVYAARVSNQANQENMDTAPRLLAYLVRNHHWSPFETSSMTVEVETSRAIAAQIIRHRSFVFQEFSQRYAEATEFETYEARRQDTKNRQNSIDDLSEWTKEWFSTALHKTQVDAWHRYQEALDRGVAKECARFLLPLSTATRLYMTGSARSFLHYIQVRTDPSTQIEHREIALAIRDIFIEQFPNTAAALEWT